MGNLDSLRDWGHAKDYVEMQWLMLQQEVPEDYVIATGVQKTVREFIEMAALALGWGMKNENPILWTGKGVNEVGRRSDTGEIVIKIDPRYFRPTEVDTLLGDASKAKIKLNWSPKRTLIESLPELITYYSKEDK